MKFRKIRNNNETPMQKRLYKDKFIFMCSKTAKTSVSVNECSIHENACCNFIFFSINFIFEKRKNVIVFSFKRKADDFMFYSNS